MFGLLFLFLRASFLCKGIAAKLIQWPWTAHFGIRRGNPGVRRMGIQDGTGHHRSLLRIYAFSSFAFRKWISIEAAMRVLWWMSLFIDPRVVLENDFQI